MRVLLHNGHGRNRRLGNKAKEKEGRMKRRLLLNGHNELSKKGEQKRSGMLVKRSQQRR
jgi:hypothetical protein